MMADKQPTLSVWTLFIMFIFGWAAIFALIFYFSSDHHLFITPEYDQCVNGTVVHVDAHGNTTQKLNELGIPIQCNQEK